MRDRKWGFWIRKENKLIWTCCISVTVTIKCKFQSLISAIGDILKTGWDNPGIFTKKGSEEGNTEVNQTLLNDLIIGEVRNLIG